MTIFREFRRLIVAIEDLAQALKGFAAVQREAGPAIDRLNELELSRHLFEAQIGATLLKAEGKLKAASNAEARERQLRKSYERDIVGPLDPDGAEGPEERGELLPVNAPPGEAQGVHPLRLGVAPNNKTLAVRAKFGLT